jgi:hypothetical protein
MPHYGVGTDSDGARCDVWCPMRQSVLAAFVIAAASGSGAGCPLRLSELIIYLAHLARSNLAAQIRWRLLLHRGIPYRARRRCVDVELPLKLLRH